MRPPERAAAPPADPFAAMRRVVARHCPEPDGLEGAAPDPMRDLEAAERLRLAGSSCLLDPLVWSWLPYCPERPADAEREVLMAARRLGLGPGPLDLPGGGDELAERRRRRG